MVNRMRHLLSWPLMLAAATSAAAADDAPPLKVAMQRDDDRVDVRIDRGRITLDVYSPRGISRATIQRTGARWPDSLVLRLHLKGLEHFRVGSGKVRLEGAVSVEGGKPQLRLWNEGFEDRPLDEKSDYWIDVQLLDAKAPPAPAAIEGGYFELQLPPALFVANPASITVAWIDFYRH
jgi:hypothetical protein